MTAAAAPVSNLTAQSQPALAQAQSSTRSGDEDEDVGTSYGNAAPLDRLDRHELEYRASHGGAGRPLPPQEDPSCWSAHEDEEGHLFYYNERIDSSVWERPACLGPLPAGYEIVGRHGV